MHRLRREARRAAGLGVATLLAAPIALLAACSSAPAAPGDPVGIAVKASDTACQVADTTLQAGTLMFTVSNAGSQPTEVHVYAPGDRSLAAVDNIGPSTSKRLTVTLRAGQYQIACRPGGTGQGIRTAITVKAPSGAEPTTSPQLQAAIAEYHKYVLGQVDLLKARTEPFVAAVIAGDAAKARSLYAAARAPYETIAPIAQAFGDLDPRINARIDDVENGQEWIGFHRLEHDLWAAGDFSKDAEVARKLQADVAKLADAMHHAELTTEQIGYTAKSLLIDARTTKVTGEEERYSGLDLVDLDAAVSGARMAYQTLRQVVLAKDPDLVAKLDSGFGVIMPALAEYGSGTNVVPYDSLSKAEINALADDLDALIGPISKLTAAALKD